MEGLQGSCSRPWSLQVAAMTVTGQYRPVTQVGFGGVRLRSSNWRRGALSVQSPTFAPGRMHGAALARQNTRRTRTLHRPAYRRLPKGLHPTFKRLRRDKVYSIFLRAI